MNEKFILLAFADHSNDSGYCFPSFRRIAWKCGVSRDTVKRCVSKLKVDGLIQILEEGKGRGHAPHYKVITERGSKLPPFISEGRQTQNKGGQNDLKGCTAMPPESSLEPSNQELEPGPQKPRPVISSFSDFVKTKSMTPQQVYSTVGKLSNEAMRMIGNGLRGADLKESLKTWAARNGVEYDADIVRRALDVADGKSKTASGAK